MLVPGGRVTNLTRPHEIKMKDSVTSYISWAISEGYGVLDVNIPEYITSSSTEEATESEKQYQYSSNETDLARVEGEKLAGYLYTNYIEPNDHSHVILIGAGNAFHAITRLLTETEAVQTRLAGVLGFVGTNPVRPIGTGNNPWLRSWYKENSLIFVTETHNLWKSTKQPSSGKISSRYGNVHSSKGSYANEVMWLNQQDAREWIKEKCKDDNETEDEVLADNGVVADNGVASTIEDPLGMGAAAPMTALATFGQKLTQRDV